MRAGDQIPSTPEVALGAIYRDPPRNGLTRPKSMRGEGYLMVNMGELFTYDRIAGKEQMERVPMELHELQHSSLERGDLLFARQSLVASGVGKCSIVLDVPEPMTFESHIVRIRLDQKKCDPRFIYYFFRSPMGRGRVLAYVNQVAAAGIRGSDLARLKVPFPSRGDQAAVADVLSAFDDLIENNTRRIELLEQMARCLYRGEVGNLEEKCSSNSPLPTGWTRIAVGDLAGFRRGLSYHGEDIVEDGGVRFVGLKCMRRDGGFRSEGIKRYSGRYRDEHLVHPGDIIVAITDMTPERRIVGHVARVPRMGEETAVMSMDLVALVPGPRVPPEYLHDVLRYSAFSLRLRAHANGANVLHLNPRAILKQRILVPPPGILRSYAETSSRLNDMSDRLVAADGVLRSIRDRLLPSLLSGGITAEGKRG